MNKNKKVKWFWEEDATEKERGSNKGKVTDILDNSEINISIRIPGFRKEEIELIASENQIHIKAESKKEMTGEKEGYEKIEYMQSEFYRTIPIPAYLDSEKIRAKFENGLLKIMIPKKTMDKDE